MEIQEHELIDLDFALNQLSGNQTLLFQLFKRFANEYEATEDKVVEFKRCAQTQQLRDYVHTLKGVAGNLGFSALMKRCKEYEDCLKHSNHVPEIETRFLDTVTATIDKLTVLMAQQDPSDRSHASIKAKNELLAQLESNNFIATPILNKLLLALQSTDKANDEIRNHISAFNYRDAIAIIKQL